MVIMADELFFMEWLNEQLRQRGWTQGELARRCGLSRSGVNKNLRNLAQKPSPETCNAIARALNLAPITVFRAAGWLPEDQDLPELDELREKFSKLSPNGRQQLIARADVLLEFEKKRGNSAG